MNQKISFKVGLVTDVTFYPFLNDEILEYYASDERLSGYSYFSFLMPDHDSTLAISGNRFYPDKEYSFSEVFHVSYLLDNRDKVKAVVINGLDEEGKNVELARSEKEVILITILIFSLIRN